MRLPLRRLGAVVATATLAASGVTLLAGPASAITDPRPMTIGADWLDGQLVNGLQQSSFGGPDVGLTIDSMVALSAVDQHTSDFSTIINAIGPELVKTGSGNFGYAESDEYSFPANDFVQKGYYASGIAKSLYFAKTFGVANIPTWAGADLVADLEGLVATTGPSNGRVEDDSSFGDYANVLSQAYAAADRASAMPSQDVSIAMVE